MKPNESKENLVKVQISYRHKEKGIRKDLLLYPLVGIMTSVLLLFYARFATLKSPVKGSQSVATNIVRLDNDTSIAGFNRLYLHTYVMNDILEQYENLYLSDNVGKLETNKTDVENVTGTEDIKKEEEIDGSVSPEETESDKIKNEENKDIEEPKTEENKEATEDRETKDDEGVTEEETEEESDTENDEIVIEKPEIDDKDYNFTTGWTTTRVNVRECPTTESDILKTYKWNTKVQYAKYDDKWAVIKYNDETAFMAIDYISKSKTDGVAYDTPSENQKSYMPYTAITSKSSKQYKLQQQAYTGNYGVRMINGRYLVAIGSYYTTQIGVYFDLVLENGTVIPCILGDAKADQHTDSTHRYTKHDGSVAEFIIDSSAIASMVRRMGSLSYACDEWNSPIDKIIIYDKSI